MSDQSEGSERRTARFLAGIESSVRLDGQDHACRVKSLSRSGALLVGRLPASAGMRVGVILSSPTGDLRVEADARVARVEGESGPPTRIAVDFETLSGDARQTLELLISRVVEGLAPAALETLEANATPEQIREALEATPVTHRASLAVRCVPRMREILFHDTDATVLDGLARNPTLTPPELRTLLRRRHLLPRTLERLSQDGRFRGMEELRVLIACHPNAPLAAAERVVGTLTPDGRKRALRHPGLNPTLRARLARMRD